MMNLETYYLMGLPIPLQYKLGTIYPPTIKYMLENNVSYDDFLKPFLIRVDILEKPNDSIKDLDLLFSKVGDTNSLINLLVDSLKIIYKTENIRIHEEICIITIDDKFMIHRDNYTYLADIVLEMMYVTRVKPSKKETKYKNKQLQETWEKLQKYREKEKKKKELKLVDILNMLIHVNQDFNYDKVLNLTYYQVMNSYITLSKKEGYNEYMMYKTSGQFEMGKDLKHWSLETKVKKSAYSEKE